MGKFIPKKQFWYDCVKKEVVGYWQGKKVPAHFQLVGSPLQYNQSGYIRNGDLIGRVTYNRFRSEFKVIHTFVSIIK